MKESNKIISIASGVIFLWQAVSAIRSMISQIMAGGLSVYFVINLYGAIVLAVMGIYALCRKKRGKVLNVLGIVYIGVWAVRIASFMRYGIAVRAIINVAVTVAAFVLSQKSTGGTVFNAKDTSSEAAKKQTQTDKQISIYDEQLRDGILTQEEYNQIMKNSKDMPT